jgi:hypothetical protein
MGIEESVTGRALKENHSTLEPRWLKVFGKAGRLLEQENLALSPYLELQGACLPLRKVTNCISCISRLPVDFE